MGILRLIKTDSVADQWKLINQKIQQTDVKTNHVTMIKENKPPILLLFLLSVLKLPDVPKSSQHDLISGRYEFLHRISTKFPYHASEEVAYFLS